jgi:hypothetical protein
VKTPASIVIAVAVLGALVTRAPVHAQPASRAGPAGGEADPLSIDDDGKAWNRGVPVVLRREARTLFLEGNRLFWIPLFARAAEHYNAALRKWKHPAFYFNLALAELNLGQQVEAREHFARAVQHGAEPLGTERFQEATKQRIDLERQLGQIASSCSTTGAEVTLDGTLLFTGPGRYEGWVQARPHEITAKKPDHLSEARRVIVSAGARETLDLRLTTLGEAADRSRRWKTWKPWAVVASGATIAAASGIVHAIAARTFRSYDDEFAKLPCAMGNGCAEGELPPSLRARLDRAELEQKLAVTGYIAGGAIAATGAVLLYMNRSRLREDAAQSGAIAIVPAVSPSTIGLLVTVSH